MYDPLLLNLLITALTFSAVFLFAFYGWRGALALVQRQEAMFERVLVQQLLMDIHPRVAMGLSVMGVLICALTGYLLLDGHTVAMFVGAAIGVAFPPVTLKHLETRRRRRLEAQLVDALTTLASGVRAGLTLVQSMELLVTNSAGPVKQEFAQLLREYHMGLDLNQCMRNASNRIGLKNYRLVFTAIEMHRVRGGDTGESLDRIAESIREIQRLEGKLDALTAQGRMQAWMMAAMPFVLLGIFYLIDPQAVTLLFTEPTGKVLLLIALALIVAGFLWIRRIMAVDI